MSNLSKKILSLTLILFSFVNGNSQITNSYFWKGSIKQNINNKSIYAFVNDSIYLLESEKYVYKGKSFNSSQSVINTFIDSTNTIWNIYNNFIVYSSNEGKSWNTYKSPPTNISKAKLLGDYIYISDYSKLYRINTKISNSNWELIYSGERLQDYTISENGTLFISEYMFAIYKSKDQGRSWIKTNWSTNIVSSTPGTLKIINNRLFVGTWWHGIFYSDDEGETWLGDEGATNPISTGFGQAIQSFGVSEFVNNDKGIIFAFASDAKSNKGFYYSVDFGKKFEKFNTNLSVWDEQFLTDLIIKDSSIYINDGYRGFF